MSFMDRFCLCKDHHPTGPICSEIPTDPLVAEKVEFHYSVCKLRGISNRLRPHKRVPNLSRTLGTEEGF